MTTIAAAPESILGSGGIPECNTEEGSELATGKCVGHEARSTCAAEAHSDSPLGCDVCAKLPADVVNVTEASIGGDPGNNTPRDLHGGDDCGSANSFREEAQRSGVEGDGGGVNQADCAASAAREASPPRTWAQRIAKDRDAAAAVAAQQPRPAATAPCIMSAAKQCSLSADVPNSASTSANAGHQENASHAKSTFFDFLVYLSANKQQHWQEQEQQEDAEERSCAPAEQLPEELRRFESCLDGAVMNTSKASYTRLGIRNDSNTCYVNVVVQALLQCSALLWLLRRCEPSGDVDRPFYTCLARICREFHCRKPDGTPPQGPLHVLGMPQVKDIISRWQRLGVQQDAGEFLFYLLNGLHEECKWSLPGSGAGAEGVPAAPDASGTGDASEDVGNEWAHLVKTSQRRAETRSAGLHEDSPIARIFGGQIRSVVRSRGAKADSVSLEPFQHLDLDISQTNVTSVHQALEAFCNPEAVLEGQATRRLQFRELPKVLILTLKRFAYARGKGGPQKIKKTIKYSERLSFDRNWLADGLQAPEYWLTAMICHHGDSAVSGHYTAVVRYNREWFLYDDTVVRQVDAREVGTHQSAAYLLVYQCHGEVDLRP
mmetsp:Transcript_127745/g.255147  ORF Transcript_127745/g.255147 Transcript_127745/m.255147 type:complete len:604 (-) Transcript_127745:88-1899(-)